MASSSSSSLGPVWQWSCLDDPRGRESVCRAAALASAEVKDFAWLCEDTTMLIVGNQPLVKTEKVNKDFNQ